MFAHENVVDPKPPQDFDSPFTFTMEGADSGIPPQLLPRYWAPGWNSPQALNRLREEDGGVVLIQPESSSALQYFNKIPQAFQAQKGKWFMVPLYHIFGSDELSLLSPGIQEQAPRPYLAMNARDAIALGVEEGGSVEVSLSSRKINLIARITPTLPDGIVGVPVGLPGLSDCGIGLPTWCVLSRHVFAGAA